MTEDHVPDAGGQGGQPEDPQLEALNDIIDQAEQVRDAVAPYGSGLLDIVNSPGFRATLNLMNSPALAAAQSMATSTAVQNQALELAALLNSGLPALVKQLQNPDTAVWLRGSVRMKKMGISGTITVTPPGAAVDTAPTPLEAEIAGLPATIQKNGVEGLTNFQVILFVLLCLAMLGVPVANAFLPATVQVVVDGEEQMVPLVVAIAVYMRKRGRR